VRFLRFPAALTALLTILAASPVLAATTMYAAQQSVPNDEMLRWIYNIPFPQQCATANQAVRDLRFKPTTDVATMQKTITAMKTCANSNWAKHNVGLQNSAFFAAAAASLIAARQEPPQQALHDASFAKAISAALVKYTQQPNEVLPSIYRTNSSRMHADAVALLPAIQAAQNGAAPAPMHS